MSVRKPKYAGDRNPNKQKIYSTENITGMYINETKTKEETLADLIQGTEESDKDTTETHGKTTPAT